MFISDLQVQFRSWFIAVVSSNTFLQVAPFIVLFGIPTLVFSLAPTAKRVFELLTYNIVMVLDNIGFGFPWIWGPAGQSSSSTHDGDKRKGKKRHARTRAEQIALSRTGSSADDESACYPGLVNMSGTYCFMNSTLQAMASLCYLQPQLDAIHSRAEVLDVPTPVVDALQALFKELNTPASRHSSLRPHQIVAALSEYSAQSRSNSLLHSREHQDAQELFQLLTECIKSEITAIGKERVKDRGLGDALSFGLTPSPSSSLSSTFFQSHSQDPNTDKWIGKSVFDGLTANRRSCMDCRYTEAVMHFAFDNWQLSVPPYAKCNLEECLADYTRLEILTDCVCRKCSLVATHKRLVAELESLEQALQTTSSKGHDSNPDTAQKRPSNSKKRRAKEVAKMIVKVRSALEEGRIEDELDGVRVERVLSRTSTKQAMIARPPPVLALHLNRSSYGHYAAKNNVFVVFPEILDLSPYSTSGKLSLSPNVPISSPPPLPFPLPPRSRTPTPVAYDQVRERVLYRLSAVVCHYGSHSFGHYVCYRRRPRPLSKDGRWAPPTIAHPMTVGDTGDTEVDGESESYHGGNKSTSGTRADQFTWENEDPVMHRSGRGWLRVSDDSVRECGIDAVLQEGSGAFMLYYERIVIAPPNPYPSMPVRDAESAAAGLTLEGCSPRSSEETLKPELRTLQLNGSVHSLVSEVGVGVQRNSSQDHVASQGLPEDAGSSWHASGSSPPGFGVGARIVRSIATGRSRSTSSAPPDNDKVSLTEVASKSTHKGKGKLASRPISVSTSDDALVSPPQSAQSPSIKPARSEPTHFSTLEKGRNFQRPPPAPRLHSPQPPPPPPQAVGLKA